LLGEKDAARHYADNAKGGGGDSMPPDLIKAWDQYNDDNGSHKRGQH
jgi:hypothetical protein